MYIYMYRERYRVHADTENPCGNRKYRRQKNRNTENGSMLNMEKKGTVLFEIEITI